MKDLLIGMVVGVPESYNDVEELTEKVLHEA